MAGSCRRNGVLPLGLFALGCFVTPNIWANCENSAGQFVSLTGTVAVQSSKSGDWHPVDLATELCEGDTVRVSERSRATIALANDAVLRLDEATTIRLLDVAGDAEEEQSLLELVKGMFQSFSRKPRRLTVNTPYLNGSIEGTEFVARVDGASAAFTVFEGVVVTANAHGVVSLQPGESARAVAGAPPARRVLVNPREQAQWSLYYPPVLSLEAIGEEALRPAAECAVADDLRCAFSELEAIPEDARTATFFVLRAALLLTVGQVTEARPDIDRALTMKPNEGRALALRAVISVAQNDTQTALDDAEAAVASAPESTASHVALSYVLQSRLDLSGARASLVAALERSANDALVYARLAEIELMLGRRSAALAAARRAVELDATLARSHSILGFSALAEINPVAASTAFDTAIRLDSDDPLPHLGRGLARIRMGDTSRGRRDLEAAVALDSNNALLRAYLGKAYFEERRAPLDAEQLAIARELDSKDPTAYLYEALRLQSVNQPGEAFSALKSSIARNDNRAVYRSRLLVDSDRAARGSSLARVFTDLGFEKLGLNEATRSLTIDPSNASAHRFLSDVYRDGAERVEIARVSELLQSQLLQDVNINPIQPSQSATNLNLAAAGGPAEAGFNEFTPLFERDQIRFTGTGFGGANDTVGGETVLSLIQGPVSASAGYFKYDTEGFRDNNDLEHDIADIYAQWAVTSSLNVQMEYLWRDTEHGDLRQNFDLEDLDESYRRSLESHVWRAGARFSPAPHSDFLFSYINSDVESGGGAIPVDIPGLITVTEDQQQTDKADQFEGQYIYRARLFNVQAGASHAAADIDGSLTATATVTIPPPFPGFPPFEFVDIQQFPIESRTADTRGYIYTNVQLPHALVATLGVSYQTYDSDLPSDGIVNDFDRVNPKLGIRWDLLPGFTVRAAYVEAIKPILVSNRTLEPTQVAGFNQFFDDPDGTRSERYGIGADWAPRENLHLGGEWTHRNVESPVLDLTNADIQYEDREEWLHRIYLTWLPDARWALRAEGVRDEFENANGSLLSGIVADAVSSWTVPLEARYFDPSGWFGTLRVSYVDQEVTRDPLQSTLAQGDSQFALVDLGIGFRMPNRQGLLSLTVRNLLDKSFDYQDNSYRTFSDQPYVGPYVPERTLMVRMTVNF